MAIRGIRFAGLIEFGAFALIGAFVALLTLMPWWLAVLIYAVFWVGALRLRRWERERDHRRMRRLDEGAELERVLVRAAGERSEALRCRGGVVR